MNKERWWREAAGFKLKIEIEEYIKNDVLRRKLKVDRATR